jgi:hypothetical protein
MKKVMFFMVMIMIMISHTVLSQIKGDVCAPLNQKRTLAEMGEFLMRDGVYFENLRASYAEAVSFSIDSTVSSDKEGILWILRNTIFIDQDFIVPSQYENGVRYASKISFTNLTGNPSENWAAVQYRGEDHVYSKVSCMNPQKIKGEYKRNNPKTKVFIPESKEQHVSFEDINVNHKMDTLVVLHIMQEQLKEVEPEPVVIPTTPKKTWFRKNLPWIIPVGAAIIAGSAYLLTKKDKTSPVIIEDRTMPPGLPATPTPPTGGLPSDSRGMPGGQG